MHDLKKGDKIIITTTFNNQKGLHVSTVVEVNKTTAKLDCGNTVKLECYEIHEQYKNIVSFFKRWSFDSTAVPCEIRGKDFTHSPEYAYVYSQKKYEEVKAMIISQIKEEEKYTNRKNKEAEVLAPYEEFKQQEEMKLQLKLRDVFINSMCKKCSHYKENGTCDRDNDDFYQVGVLSESEKRFFDGHSSMCHWDIKEN
jgi:hypothetical protein